MNLHHKSLWGRVFLAIAVTFWLNGCSDQGFLTPPSQQFGATLNSQGNDLHPRFSYQGNYLVFDSDRQSQQGIYLYDVRKRVLINLPGVNQANSFQYQPDLSADGRYLVYVSEEEGQTDIFVYDRQSLEKENLTKDELGEVRYPTISGNGRFVAFEMNRNGQWDIVIFDRGSKAEITLPETAPLDPTNTLENKDQSSN